MWSVDGVDQQPMSGKEGLLARQVGNGSLFSSEMCGTHLRVHRQYVRNTVAQYICLGAELPWGIHKVSTSPTLTTSTVALASDYMYLRVGFQGLLVCFQFSIGVRPDPLAIGIKCVLSDT